MRYFLQDDSEYLDLKTLKTNLSTKASIDEVIVIEEKSNEALAKAEQALQSGVNAKNSLVQAINSKVTVPDITNDASWSDIALSVSNIKEGRGDAQTSHVLSGKTFTNDSGILSTGTMPDRGGAQTITPGTTNKVLNSGYYSGNITISGSSNLQATNIKKGVNIFGITGTLDAAPKTTTGGNHVITYCDSDHYSDPDYRVDSSTDKWNEIGPTAIQFINGSISLRLGFYNIIGSIVGYNVAYRIKAVDLISGSSKYIDLGTHKGAMSGYQTFTITLPSGFYSLKLEAMPLERRVDVLLFNFHVAFNIA